MRHGSRSPGAHRPLWLSGVARPEHNPCASLLEINSTPFVLPLWSYSRGPASFPSWWSSILATLLRIPAPSTLVLASNPIPVVGSYTCWQPPLPRHPHVCSDLPPRPAAGLSPNLPRMSNSFHCPGPPGPAHLLRRFLSAVLTLAGMCSWLWILHVTFNRDGTVTHRQHIISFFPTPFLSIPWNKASSFLLGSLATPPSPRSPGLNFLFRSQLFSPFLGILPAKLPFCYYCDLTNLFLNLPWPLQSLWFSIFFFFFPQTNFPE